MSRSLVETLSPVASPQRALLGVCVYQGFFFQPALDIVRLHIHQLINEFGSLVIET